MKTQYAYTTQTQVRAAFWQMFPNADKRKIAYERLPNGKIQKVYLTDTRVAFVDFVDSLARNGAISNKLAQRVTL